jgi:ADP-ribosylglycohydrolase
LKKGELSAPKGANDRGAGEGENRGMNASREKLSDLFRTGGIDIRHGEIFDRRPTVPGGGFGFDRFEGMMLGLAVGDSLGNSSESLRPSDRERAYGEIRDYLPNRHAGDRRVGLPSDDTQLAFWTLEQMFADDGRMIPENVAHKFVASGPIYGIGKATREFVERFRGGIPWDKAGVKSCGNGTIMRIAPVVYPHLRIGTEALWADAALLAMVTHNDSGAIASCVAFTAMLWELLSMDRAPAPGWWVERFVEIAGELESDSGYRSNAPGYSTFRGSIGQFVGGHLPPAFEKGLSAREACDGWYSGAYMLETMPSALYILMKHANDPEEAIIRAVNDTVDNDSIAAVVGAAVGALHGKGAIPKRWLESLLGRTGNDDDGKVFEILRVIRPRFAGASVF